MSHQEVSLLERLGRAPSPLELHDWRNRDGYYVTACRVSPEDIPALIDLATNWDDEESMRALDGLDVDPDSQELVPVTAWRTLGDLRAESAIAPLIDMLRNGCGELDDWLCEDLPYVLGRIGIAAVAPLAQLASGSHDNLVTCGVALEGLRRVSKFHPETRDRIVAVLMEFLTHAEQDTFEFNSLVVNELLEMRAVEAADLIERAFAADLLDVSMLGEWDDIRQELVTGEPKPEFEFGTAHDARIETSTPTGRLAGPIRRNSDARVGRNEPCPCGSGKKYKKCCLRRE